jgi:succinate dehydrogenase hydrophobic anchor subunit
VENLPEYFLIFQAFSGIILILLVSQIIYKLYMRTACPRPAGCEKGNAFVLANVP